MHGTVLALVAATALLVGTPAQAATTALTVTSPAVSAAGQLPAEFTCDGASATLPLSWTHVPRGTRSFALLMDHVPPEGGHHWYWVMWGIPARTTTLPTNVSGVGFLGGNSVNRSIGYAPPCSKGPGLKKYTITVYALSAKPVLPSTSTAAVTRDILLKAITPITIAKGELDVTYSR